MKLVEKGVSQKEPRYIHRAVRSLQSLRKKVTDPILRRVVSIYFPPSKELLIDRLVIFFCSCFLQARPVETRF